MGFGHNSYVADRMLKNKRDEEKVSIRNMSDEELLKLNKAWGMSICHSYRINGYRVDQKESAAYPAHNSMKVLKAVREKLRSNQI
jgi:hypothetical protein